MTDCPACTNPPRVNPDCVPCCVRWFANMPNDEWRAYNSGLLLAMTNPAHMDAVRVAYKKLKTDAVAPQDDRRTK